MMEFTKTVTTIDWENIIPAMVAASKARCKDYPHLSLRQRIDIVTTSISFGRQSGATTAGMQYAMAHGFVFATTDRELKRLGAYGNPLALALNTAGIMKSEMGRMRGMTINGIIVDSGSLRMCRDQLDGHLADLLTTTNQGWSDKSTAKGICPILLLG